MSRKYWLSINFLLRFSVLQTGKYGNCLSGISPLPLFCLLAPLDSAWASLGLCLTRILSNEISFCLHIKTFLKWDMALWLKMLMLQLATTLSELYCSTKLCTSPHFAQILWIKELGTSSLSSSSSEHISSTIAFCCCSWSCSRYSLLSSFLWSLLTSPCLHY